MLAQGLIGVLFCFLASASAHTLWLLLPLTFVCCTFGGLTRPPPTTACGNPAKLRGA